MNTLTRDLEETGDTDSDFQIRRPTVIGRMISSVQQHFSKHELSATRLGYVAYCEGNTYNPYPIGSDDHSAWQCGQESAIRDRDW